MFLHHPLMHGTFPVMLVNVQQLAGVVSLMPLFGKKRRGQREDKKKHSVGWKVSPKFSCISLALINGSEVGQL